MTVLTHINAVYSVTIQFYICTHSMSTQVLNISILWVRFYGVYAYLLKCPVEFG